MKIVFINPYWHILGGGERYLLTIAEYLSRNHKVYIFADESIKSNARRMFNISVDRIHFLPLSMIQTKSILQKLYLTYCYDLLFYMTDGSLFFSTAKKNFLVIQSPVHLPVSNTLNRIKLLRWNIICYSQFMSNIIGDKIHKKVNILSPCVDVKHFQADSHTKENIILTVGRFFQNLHNKKQEILLEIFKKNYQMYFKGWKLIIAGGLTQESGSQLLKKLRKECKGFPVEIIVNPSFNNLIKLYQKAKIYWHAAGFGEDERIHPERAEHFGITTLEAMAAGIVPVVYKAGGQLDIIEHDQNGLFWRSEEELAGLTANLVNNNRLLGNLSKNAVSRAQNFSCQNFYEKADKLINQ